MKKDLASVLPGVPVDSVLIIPCCQRSSLDLIGVGAAVAAEKDLLLERFAAFAERVSSCLGASPSADPNAGASSRWVDWADPCSGLPVRTRNVSVVYPEADTMQLLLRYRTESAGLCKVLMHPRWGSHVYPATIFAIAPQEELLAALGHAGREEAGASSGVIGGSSASGEAGTAAPTTA